MKNEQPREGDTASPSSVAPNQPVEATLGERTLRFVAQSYSVPDRTVPAIGECTINTRNLKIADAIAAHRKLSPKSTI
ncbi:MAG: hypothetical protein WA632_14030 [Gallionella sp.]